MLTLIPTLKYQSLNIYYSEPLDYVISFNLHKQYVSFHVHFTNEETQIQKVN